MAFKDVLSLCGRIGLIMTAFAFVAGIVLFAGYVFMRRRRASRLDRRA